MSKELELKSIKDLIDKQYNFFIPSYQRGYRWSSRQVEDLLQDIFEFSQNKKNENEFYCLQPLVVLPEKIENKKRYRVIDGQQRLTTIYIILKYLKNSSEKFNDILKDEKYKEILEFCSLADLKVPDLYTIEYETRQVDGNSSKKFLEETLTKDFDSKPNLTNPDFYYMSNAYITVSKWFKDKNRALFLDTLLNQTKVIWYDVSSENMNNINYEIEIFTRLNIGKISLTNAELIKAMLLIPIKSYKEQIEFSAIWDNMEQTLQNDEFWYFLTNEEKSDTAIDLIFNLLAETYNEDLKEKDKIEVEDDKFSFYLFDKVLKYKTKSELGIWKEAQEYFRYFVDWFNNKEIYHKAGYLINEKKSLLELIELYKDKTKSLFIEELDKHIKVDVNLMQLEYNNKRDVKRVLLLFNIETILNNKSSNDKFQFNKYKKESWDIEHIASQTDNINKKEWIKTTLEYIEGKNNPTKDEIDEKEKNFDEYFKEVKDKLEIKDITEESKDNIGNLTLLDSKTNRGYGNAFFPVKRAIIIQKDSEGTFIPIATKNLFLKQYSKKLSDMMNWNDSDIEDYRENIFELLNKYGVKNDKIGE
ncbi:MAG: DUF262 domain-containing protein [Arcobacter sp.]|nr:DUF262 domain-containing protein [Arcobacter sp.]